MIERVKKDKFDSPAYYEVGEHMVCDSEDGEHVYEILAASKKGILWYYDVKNVDNEYGANY